MKFIRIYKDGSDAIETQKRLIPLDAVSWAKFQGVTVINLFSCDGDLQLNLLGGSMTQADVDALNAAMQKCAASPYPENVVDWYPKDGTITSTTIT
jgi:hypothetical protein